MVQADIQECIEVDLQYTVRAFEVFISFRCLQFFLSVSGLCASHSCIQRLRCAARCAATRCCASPKHCMVQSGVHANLVLATQHQHDSHPGLPCHLPIMHISTCTQCLVCDEANSNWFRLIDNSILPQVMMAPEKDSYDLHAEDPEPKVEMSDPVWQVGHWCCVHTYGVRFTYKCCSSLLRSSDAAA